MSWLTRFLGRPRANRTDVDFPVDIDLGSGLCVHVYLHEIDSRTGRLTCWSYVTEGLMSRGQKELVFTLQCKPGEPADGFPRDPLEVFFSINGLAEQGRLVDVGGVSQFDGRKLFGRHLAYIEAETFHGVRVPPDALAAILVTDDEVQAVQEFGILRVMSRLGFASRYYPCPPWSERSRTGISFREVRQQTILKKVVSGRARGVRIVHDDQGVEVRIDRDAIPRLQKPMSDLGSDQVVALLTDIDPGANGCLVWEPGQSQPEAITAPHSDGSRLCGCFAMLVPGQGGNDVQLVEDGIALMLADDAFAEIRQALTQPSKEISVACKDGRRIMVEQVGPR